MPVSYDVSPARACTYLQLVKCIYSKVEYQISMFKEPYRNVLPLRYSSIVDLTGLVDHDQEADPQP